MSDYVDFLVGIKENSLAEIDREPWAVLRILSATEMEHLWQIDETRSELEQVIAEFNHVMSEERRARVRCSRDLNDDELEVSERLRFARDVFKATQNAFWSPLKYEYRVFEQLKVDTRRGEVMGRGNNRSGPRHEPIGDPTESELLRLKTLLGE